MIYYTNHRNPEKDLLSKENLRQTLRLILANAFTDRVVAGRVRAGILGPHSRAGPNLSARTRGPGLAF